MYNKKTVLAIIPARGASKRLPRKNLKPLSGKPLIVWTIEQALLSKYLDTIIVSTDDKEIALVSKNHGAEVPFMRPKELAEDRVNAVEAALHALEKLSEKYDYIMLLQPTCPLRTVYDIDSCIKQCVKIDAPSCVSINKVSKSPYWIYRLADDKRVVPFFKSDLNKAQSQEQPESYYINGAIFVAKCDYLKKVKHFVTDETVAYIMPDERSFDIDTHLDFLICEFLLERRENGL